MRRTEEVREGEVVVHMYIHTYFSFTVFSSSSFHHQNRASPPPRAALKAWKLRNALFDSLCVCVCVRTYRETHGESEGAWEKPKDREELIFNFLIFYDSLSLSIFFFFFFIIIIFPLFCQFSASMDSFVVPHKSPSLEDLDAWRKKVFSLNKSRRFRYTANLAKRREVCTLNISWRGLKNWAFPCKCMLLECRIVW